MDVIGLKAILDDKNFQDGLHRYQQGIGQMEKSTNNAANIFSKAGSVMQGAFVAGIGAATVAIGAFAAASKIGLDTTLEWAEGLDKLGDQFGFSGEKASAFQYLANKVGVSIDEMGVGLNTFTRGLADMKNAQGSATLVTAKGADAIQSLKQRLEDANVKLSRAKQNLAEAKKPTDSMRYAVEDAQKAVNRLNTELGSATKLVPKAAEKASPFGEALKTLGVKAFDAKGKLRTFDDLLPELMDKFNKLPPGVKASELAMTLFGARGGGKFLDFLRQGSKGLEDAKKKAKELGLELSTDEVNAAEEFGFAVNELNLGIKGFWNQIGRQVLPIAKRLVDFINDKIIPAFSKWAKDWMPKIGDGLGMISDAIGLIIRGDWNGLIRFIDKAFGREAANNVGQFINAASGVATAIGQIADAFKTGGLMGGLQAIGDQIDKALKNVDWVKVSKNFDELKTRFWDWLTGKGGALDNISTAFGEFSTKAAAWVSSADGQKTLKGFGDAIGRTIVNLISLLLGDPTSSNDTITKYGSALDSSASTAAGAFLAAGKTIAGAIADGVVQGIQETDLKRRIIGAIAVAIFGSPQQGTGLFTEPARESGKRVADDIHGGFTSKAPEAAEAGQGMGTLYLKNVETGAYEEAPNAIDSLQYPWNQFTEWFGETFTPLFETASRKSGMNGIDSMAYGVVVNSPHLIQALEAPVSLFRAWVTGAARIFELGTWVAGTLAAGISSVASSIYNALLNPVLSAIAAIKAALSTTQLGVASGSLGGGGGSSGFGFAFGGPVNRTGMALVHAGEYVLNRQQAMQFAPMLTSPNNSRTYNFYHTWPAGVPTSQQQWTEGMVRRVTQQEMRGILGKG